MQLQQSTFISIAALCLPLGLMVACGTSSVEFGRSGAGGSDTTFTTSSSGDGGNGSDTKTCGEVELEAQPAKGRLLVLLDRSCSMNGRLRISETEKSSKWHMALGALGKVAMTQQGPEFALSFFPSESRGEERIDIPFGKSNNQVVSQTLQQVADPSDALYPGNPCCTPIDRAIQVAHDYAALRADGYSSHVALVTDGQQVGCGNTFDQGGISGALETVEKMQVEDSIRTYVVGFGGKESKKQLNALAEAGGTATAPDDTGRTYFTARDEQQLESALVEITKDTISCSVALEGLSPIPPAEKLTVELGGQNIDHDPAQTNGWSFSGEATIQLYGSACEGLKAGQALRVVADCPEVY